MISKSAGIGLGRGTDQEVSEGDIGEKYGVFSKNMTSSQTIYFLVKEFQHR